MGNDNLEYLRVHLQADFLKILGDRELKAEEKVESLLDSVDYLLSNQVVGVSFRNTHAGIEVSERNNGDLEIRTDANGDLESIEFIGDGTVADFHFL